MAKSKKPPFSRSIQLHNPKPIIIGKLQVRSIKMDNAETVIDFIYYSPKNRAEGGWLQIDKETFIRANSSPDKLKLKHAINIPLAPEKHYLNPKYMPYRFTLIFPPLPLETHCIDIIERDEPGTYFNFNQLDLSDWAEKPFSFQSQPSVENCTLTPREFEEYHVKILEVKLEIAQIRVKKHDTIADQKYEKATEMRDLERQKRDELAKLKAPLLEWYIQMEQLPETWPYIKEIYNLLQEFPQNHDYFRLTFEEMVIENRKRLLEEMVNCHTQRDIDKLLDLHQRIQKIDAFISETK